MKIWAQVICQNEENFIWFALMSVVDYVDKILVWDTGSTDKTVELIKDVQKRKPGKIEFKECGQVDHDGVTKLRQKMLDESKCDWILILDGDEVWWKQSIEKLIWHINQHGKDISAVVVPYKVPVGDIYHFQSDSAGRYKILGKIGYLTIRAINCRIPGLVVRNDYPLEGYVDNQNVLIQNRSDIEYLEVPYLHLTHLKRSSQKRVRETKKLELGQFVGDDFRFPEVFYLDRPKMVPSPWAKLGLFERVIAGIMTGLRRIKRRFK